jgi:hypothetical protein
VLRKWLANWIQKYYQWQELKNSSINVLNNTKK